MNYAALKTELALTAYTNLSDKAASDLLNTVITNGISRSIVPAKQLTGDMALFLATLDQYPDNTTVPNGVPSTATIPFLKSLVKYVMNAEIVNVQLATTQQMFGVMEAYGILQASDIANLSSQDGSRAEQLFGQGTVVTPDDVNRARTGNFG